MLHGNLLNRRTNSFGYLMTLSLPIAFWNEVYLNVGDVGTAPQKIMADQTVEVIGRGGADIHLIIGHFRNTAHIVRNLTRHRGGLFERRAFGHINNHLKLALVIERQHLYTHELQSHQTERQKQQQSNQRQKTVTPARFMNQPAHETPVDARAPTLFAL